MPTASFLPFYAAEHYAYIAFILFPVFTSHQAFLRGMNSATALCFFFLSNVVVMKLSTSHFYSFLLFFFYLTLPLSKEKRVRRQKCLFFCVSATVMRSSFLPFLWRCRTLRCGAREISTQSTVLLAKARRGGGIASAGLWSGRRLLTARSANIAPSQLLSKTRAHEHANKENTSSTVTYEDDKDDAGTLPVSLPTVSEQSRLTQPGIAAADVISFALDPPFTRVAGEADSAHAPNSCLYACRHCRTPLFRSSDLVDGSRVGHHSSGWPTFVAPLAASAVRLRTVLQRSLVATLTSPSASPLSGTTSSAAKPDTFQVRVPDAGMVQRGLAVEGDLVRLRGRQIGVQRTGSWRETCLRDPNHRADPVVVLGYCGHCGRPVCHVTHAAATGTRYVTTASSIEVLAARP